MISDRKISNDSCIPAPTARTNGELTQKIHIEVLPQGDTKVCNPQTCRKTSGNFEKDASGTIDDPKQGAKANEPKSSSSDMPHTKKYLIMTWTMTLEIIRTQEERLEED